MSLLCSCATKIKKPLVWKIEKDGQSSYLLGTIHWGVGAHELPDSVFKRIDSSGIFATESNMNRYANRKFSLEQFLLLSSEEPGLDQMVKPQVWQKLAQYRGDVPTESLKRYRPFTALINYVNVQNEYRTRFQAEGEFRPRRRPASTGYRHHLDEELYHYAVEKKKVVGYLESDFFLNPRSAPSECVYVAEVALLESVVMDAGGALEREVLLSDVESYRQGEIVSDKRRHWSEKAEYCLIEARNQVWLPKIIEFHRSYDSAFIAVGADHLTAKKGSLLELLQQQGFSVTRVDQEN